MTNLSNSEVFSFFLAVDYLLNDQPWQAKGGAQAVEIDTRGWALGSFTHASFNHTFEIKRMVVLSIITKICQNAVHLAFLRLLRLMTIDLYFWISADICGVFWGLMITGSWWNCQIHSRNAKFLKFTWSILLIQSSLTFTGIGIL